MLKKLLCLVSYSVFSGVLSFSQLSYNKEIIREENVLVISNIAYKLPFRGENYKFSSSFLFYFTGNAFVNNRVYNTFIEAQHLSEKNLPEIRFVIKKCSYKKSGILVPNNKRLSGKRIVFRYPEKKKEYGIYSGILFSLFHIKKKKRSIDFESTAQYIINLDNAAEFFGIKIKYVIVSRSYIKKLYESSSGKELMKRNIRFIKYLSHKINRKYEKFFLVEFE